MEQKCARKSHINMEKKRARKHVYCLLLYYTFTLTLTTPNSSKPLRDYPIFMHPDLHSYQYDMGNPGCDNICVAPRPKGEVRCRQSLLAIGELSPSLNLGALAIEVQRSTLKLSFQSSDPVIP